MRKVILLASVSAMVLSQTANAGIIASQNFNTLEGDSFTDDEVANGEALTNSGSSHVSTGGTDIGFQTFWFDTRGTEDGPKDGSESGDFIGINSFTGGGAPNVGPDGTPVSGGSEQNFQFNDGDGRLDLVFDAVNLSGETDRALSFDYWINDTGYESSDQFTATLSDGTTSVSLFDFSEPGLEGLASADDGSANWNRFSVNLDTLIADNALGETLTLTISVDTNAGTENVFVDNILFESDAASPPPPPPPVQELAIYEIQGDGFESAFAGEDATTSGIVTGVTDNGFFIQDPEGDGNDATSDGIFVFTGSAPDVAVGDEVSVTGGISEFFNKTQISAEELSVLSSGNSIDPIVLSSAGRAPETNDLAAGTAFYESLEGMLVTLPDAQVVDDQNRFGELYAIGSAGAEATGANERGGITISGPITEDLPVGDLNPERIQIDQSLAGLSNPDAGIGDNLGDVTGVLDFNFSDYSIIPLDEVTVVEARNLTAEVTELQKTRGNELSVASYNVENLDPGDGDRFEAIARQIVDNLGSPDIIALQEIQDNSGPLNDGTTSASDTLQALADAIFELTGKHYEFADDAFVEDGNQGGEPGGNIRNAFLYDPTVVTFDGQLEVPNIDGVYDGSRLPFAALFTHLVTGQEITLINNHFRSRGGSGPLFGSEQPPEIGGELRRLEQAAVLRDFITGLLMDDPDAYVGVLGDLNGFQFENFVQLLMGNAFADDVIDIEALMADLQLMDLSMLLDPTDRYSFIFEGNSQLLDQFLASALLFESLLGYDIVHINSEFSNGPSDHDALLALFQFDVPVPATVWFFLIGLLVVLRRRMASV